MGRLFTAGSSEHASNTATPTITVLPCSMSCWYKPTNFAQQAQLVVLQSNTTANREVAIVVSTGAAAQALVRGGTSTGVSTSAGTLTAGSWAHVGGTFVVGATGSRFAYLNGTPATVNNTNVGTAPALERTDIGAYFPSSVGTFGSFANGIIAMAAIWNVVLTDAEMATLARGTCPMHVRPANLKYYYPLLGTGSPEPDYTAGQKALTLTGTSQADNPPGAVLFPTVGGQLLYNVSAAGGTSNVPNLMLTGVG